jgi:hypothetical protein
MGPNRRAQERERAAARAAEEAKRAEAVRKAAAEAHKIVEIWNARQAGGRALWLYPTIGAAIAAGLPELTFYCPACTVVGSVDLRTIDRHRGAAISSLIPSLSCRRCSPRAPFAKLEALTAERPEWSSSDTKQARPWRSANMRRNGVRGLSATCLNHTWVMNVDDYPH